MCGFIGHIGIGQLGRIERALPWITGRGPDSQRTWYSRDNVVGLLHARLAIVDSDPRAHQPLVDESAGVAVALVGEIYNHRDLRRELSDYRFSTESDTEVVLASYVRDGVQGLRRLKGMYAVVIVDERQRQIVLARDPIGKKPLFIARWGNEVLFGSSLLALVAVHAKPVTVDGSVAGHYWDEAFVPPARTIIAGAIPVLPGYALVLDWSGALKAAHDCEPDAVLAYSGESAATVQSNITLLLRTAVSRRLDHNPAPLSLLSGGIDSTVVTAMAREVLERDQGRSLGALTLGAFVPGTQDEFYARYAARRLGIPLKILRPRRHDLAAEIERALDLQDEPLGMPSFFFLERMVAAAAEYGRILLTGDGGDEVFYGYRVPGEWVNPRADVQSEPEIHVGGATPGWMSDWGRKVTTSTLLGHMLAKADRASAEQAVELRCPLLDWDLVRYVRSLPPQLMGQGGVSKALLKEQLAGWPRWFLERQKLGFSYNLRWQWGVSRFAGLRERIEERALETFADRLPPPLAGRALEWKTADVLRNFSAVWRLLAWSRFLCRLDRATNAERELRVRRAPA